MTLRLTGGKELHTDCEAAWAALHDVECLRPCIRNCLSLAQVSATRFALTVLVPMGPVSMAFSGSVTIEDAEAPSLLVLRACGTGGLAGLAEGTARLTLSETQAGCRLDYAIEADPSGPIAFAGMMLLSGLARSLVDDFAARFAEQVSRPYPAIPLRPAASGAPAAR